MRSRNALLENGFPLLVEATNLDKLYLDSLFEELYMATVGDFIASDCFHHDART